MSAWCGLSLAVVAQAFMRTIKKWSVSDMAKPALEKIENPLNAIQYAINNGHEADAFLNDWWHGEWWPEYVTWCETSEEAR